MRQLMLSFDGLMPPPAILEKVEQGQTAAFCLFGSMNGASPAGLRALTDALREAAARGGHLPPLIAIDQEGGQLQAITGSTELPGNLALGAARSPELAYKAGMVLGRELRAMGLNLNFAPAVDVNINPANPVIGTRAFGDNPTLIAELGVAMIRGMQDQGIIATAKHFPGHGDTGVDTHFAAPILEHTVDRIESVELPPFQAAIDAGVGAVMTSHIILSAYDPDHPATLSRALLIDLLRGRLGFDGLIVTDAMDMHAVARLGHANSVRMALEAGADLITLAHLPDQLGLLAQFSGRENPVSIARIEAAQKRAALDPLPLDLVRCDEHQQIAQEIADRSITLVKDNGRLPLQPDADAQIAVITPEPVDLTPADTSSWTRITLAEQVRAYHPNTVGFQMPRSASAHEIAALLRAVETAEVVIVGTISADTDPGQAELVNALIQRGQRPIVVALRTPYDLMVFPAVDTYLCAYSIRTPSLKAAARVLFGQIEAQGVLPCTIPAHQP
jgi:beta-N-acetylhexosaminidase